MRRFLVMSFYLLAIILDSMRAFYFSFHIFENETMLSFYSYIIISFLSISPVLWFSLITGEKNARFSFKTISIIKLFSIISALMFFLETIKKDDGFQFLGDMEVYIAFFLIVDVVMLCFSLLRGMKLCK